LKKINFTIEHYIGMGFIVAPLIGGSKYAAGAGVSPAPKY
jgi:hypothetical protein